MYIYVCTYATHYSSHAMDYFLPQMQKLIDNRCTV